VDAFAFSDKALKSLIGCYDGKPYERIYDWVSNENTMNKHGVMKGITQLKNINPKL
jgi:acyl-CoA oxidase